MGAIAKLHYERRSAAILSTDLVGYSAITHADEERSMRIVATHGRIAGECAARHGGRILKATGDGFLIELADARVAVDCGLAILRAHREADGSAPPDQRIRLRIGIHSGEILEHEEGAYGEDIDVAVRIQSIAPANSVAFSRPILEAVRATLPFPIVELGDPIGAYAVLPEGAAQRRRIPRRATTRAAFLGAIVVSLAVAVAAGFTWNRSHGAPLRSALTAPPRFEAAGDAGSPANRARWIYLRGVHAMNDGSRASLLESIDRFREALGIDPAFADAYVAMANAYLFLGFYGHIAPEDAWHEQLRYANRAIALAPANGNAHMAVASGLAFYLHDWKAAEAEYRRAIELDPENVTVHLWFADFLNTQARWREAAGEVETAVGLAPESLNANGQLAGVRVLAGDIAGALAYYRRALRLDATFLQTRVDLAGTLLLAGQSAEALRVLREAPGKAPATDPAYAAMLVHALVANGERAEAERIDRELRLASRDRYVPAYFLARSRQALGDASGAIRLLEKAIDERSIHAAYLKVDPEFASLRDRADFRALLTRLGF